ncbi:MAG TPA: N-acetylneuraminate synthase family protein [Phycisphaeraceae bacterium]
MNDRLAGLFAAATPEAPPRVLVVAELGVNHDGSVERALALVEAARASGADAIKLQYFHPDRLLSRQAMLAIYQQGQAHDMHDLLAGLQLTLEQIERVCQAARAAGLRCVVTPFSPADVQELRGLELDAVKIASPDAVNPLLYEAAAELGLPMLVSTGTCELDELEPVAALLRRHRAGGCLLQCVSSYPTPAEDAAMGAIGMLGERFGLPVGYSDHTPELISGALAVAAGAVVLEKHFTYDRAAAGPDHAASLDPAGFARYVQMVRQATAMMGPRAKAVLPVEMDVRRVSRQSLCATRDLPAGHVIQREDLTVKRPGTGLPPTQLPRLIGKRLTQPVRANELLQPQHVEQRTYAAAG